MRAGFIPLSNHVFHRVSGESLSKDDRWFDSSDLRHHIFAPESGLPKRADTPQRG
jgi:hypothetical protein